MSLLSFSTIVRPRKRDFWETATTFLPLVEQDAAHGGNRSKACTVRSHCKLCFTPRQYCEVDSHLRDQSANVGYARGHRERCGSLCLTTKSDKTWERTPQSFFPPQQRPIFERELLHTYIVDKCATVFVQLLLPCMYYAEERR